MYIVRQSIELLGGSLKPNILPFLSYFFDLYTYHYCFYTWDEPVIVLVVKWI